MVISYLCFALANHQSNSHFRTYFHQNATLFGFFLPAIPVTSPTKQSIQAAIAPASPCAAGQGAAAPGGRGGHEAGVSSRQGPGGGRAVSPKPSPEAVGAVFEGSFKPGALSWHMASVPNSAQAPGGV